MTPPGPDQREEIIGPTQGYLRTERGGCVSVMIALTPEAIWIQKTWQLRPVLLQGLVIESQQNGKMWALTPGPEPSEKLILAFASAEVGQRWYREVQARQRQLAADAPAQGDDRYAPEGVTLVRKTPEVPQVVLGRVEFTGPTQRAGDRGLQLHAGLRGADAVIELQRRTCPELGWGARNVSGLAVRVEDADARKRLRLRWYAEEVRGLVNRMLLLVVLQAALLFLAHVFCAGVSGLDVATGETRSEAVGSALLGLGLISVWPLVLVVLLWVLRWAELLRAAGLGVLVATTGRGLAIRVAHLLAIRAAGTTLAESKILLLVDPVDWALIIAGVVLCLRAWRLAGDARQILPEEVQAVPTARKAWSRGLLAVTGVYGLAFLGLVGTWRYEASTYLLQPGVDPRREHEALLAFDEGLAQANKGDLLSAEQSFQRSLRLWERLTARRPAPSFYRKNLATTLNNLGWIRDQQGRPDEAETYYARAVALGDELAGEPQTDGEFEQTMASARQALAHLRGGKSSKVLEEKERTAARKYEEAQVKAGKGEVEAEPLYRQVIALCEEILPQVSNEDYQKSAVHRLATAYFQLAELQQQLGNRSGAEATLKKGIGYGEKAVALDPDRPVPRHNLEVARRRLEGLRDQALQEEVDKLCGAERFADAIDLCLRSIEKQEEKVRSSKDRDAAARRLAFRLDRLAWLLAHCPDGRVRDEKMAVNHARRATELQPKVSGFWYTLAMVQYRNGEWRDSLASLEKVKAKEGGLDANDWFLSAMDLHQLKRRGEARAAFRKAVEWIDERLRQAEDNAVLRFQYELMRPAIEALRREAESLLEGKDPANRRVG
jgi:tetratricopeptide (TPR) repeat protein